MGDEVEEEGLEGGLIVILEPLERAFVTMSATVLRRFRLGGMVTKATWVFVGSCVVFGSPSAWGASALTPGEAPVHSTSFTGAPSSIDVRLSSASRFWYLASKF